MEGNISKNEANSKSKKKKNNKKKTVTAALHSLHPAVPALLFPECAGLHTQKYPFTSQGKEGG